MTESPKIRPQSHTSGQLDPNHANQPTVYISVVHIEEGKNIIVSKDLYDFSC